MLVSSPLLCALFHPPSVMLAPSPLSAQLQMHPVASCIAFFLLFNPCSSIARTPHLPPDHGCSGSSNGCHHLPPWYHTSFLAHRNSLLLSPTSPSQLFGQAMQRSRSRALSFAQIIHNRASSDPRFVSPLSVDPYSGEYLMTLTLGTPAQTFTAFADTGSTLVWVQCTPCNGCTDPHGPIFKQQNSSTYRPLPCSNAHCKQINALNFSRSFPPLPKCSKTCPYEYAYGGNSTTVGQLASDTVTLRRVGGGTTKVLNFTFGCAHHTSGFLLATGLVGLDRGPYSLVSQLGHLFGHAFSYCLVSQTDAINQSSSLFFGSSAFLKEKRAKYTPLIINNQKKENAFYYVQLLDISLGGKALHIPSTVFQISSDGRGGTIVDSGTTSWILTVSAFMAVHKSLQAAISYPEVSFGGDLRGLICYNTSGVRNPVFPIFTLNLKNADLEVPNKNIYVQGEGQIGKRQTGKKL